MICEYCNMYTNLSVNKTISLLPEIKKRFMLTNVDHVCDVCFTKFITAQQWLVKTQVVYSSQCKTLYNKANTSNVAS